MNWTEELRPIVTKHRTFFNSEKRKEKLSELNDAEDTQKKKIHKMFSVICNTEPNIIHILLSLFSELAKDKSEKYDILISDSQNSEIRPLLITSRLDLPSRIIISTLPIEWQGHNNLFNNITNYITEGKPEIAIITKKELLLKTLNI